MPVQRFKPALQEGNFAALSAGTILFFVRNESAEGLLMLPTWRGVPRGGGHGDEVGVFADGGFCFGRFMLGGEEVGLGFIGTHCGNRDQKLF